MIKTEILYNRLLKLCLFISGISFLLFIIDLFFAIAFQAIDCSDQICRVDSEHPFFRLTLILFALFTIAFIIFSRIIYYRITKEEKLIDVRTYKSKMAARGQLETKTVDFSKTVLYQEIIKKKEAADKAGEVKEKPQKAYKKTEVFDTLSQLIDKEPNEELIFEDEIVEDIEPEETISANVIEEESIEEESIEE
ncbi:MAG: hypothetical protein JXR62_07495, partial [Bacilli bacterium]|nr:hypothetical protein [Bacilli bacterium]